MDGMLRRGLAITEVLASRICMRVCSSRSRTAGGRSTQEQQQIMAALNHSSLICDLAWINRIPKPCSWSARFAAPCLPSLGAPFLLSPFSATSLVCSSAWSPTARAFSVFVHSFTPRAESQPIEFEIEEGEKGDEEEGEDDDSVEQQEIVPARGGFESLGNKEKKELRAYAHGLGTRLNVQHVGKLGVTQTVVNSISDALEANEILKVKVLENCSSEMTEIISRLERGTGGQVVGKIGRTILLYRASLRKLAASEKREDRPKRRSRIAMSAGRETKDAQRSRRL